MNYISLFMISILSLIKKFLHIINLNCKTTRHFFHLRRFLLPYSDHFIERGYQFSHISETCIKIISNTKYMTDEIYIERPMQMFELISSRLKNENLYFIFALDRSVNLPLIRKYSQKNN